MTAWTDLGRGLRVRQSRFCWTNSTLLLHPEHALVVDPGVLPSELDELARAVHESRAARVTLVFTHAHWDHVLGHPWWPGAATLAHTAFAARVARDAAAIAAAAADLAAREGEAWPAPFAPFASGLTVAGTGEMVFGPWRLVLRDAFGHDDTQLSIHLPESGVLIAGDMLSDIEIPLLDRAPAVYCATLEALLPLAESGAVATLVPGHGTIARGREVLERLRRDLGYLAELEFQVRAARAAGLTLAETEERLAAMDYTGKHAEYAMVEQHRDNVRHAWGGTAAAG